MDEAWQEVVKWIVVAVVVILLIVFIAAQLRQGGGGIVDSFLGASKQAVPGAGG